jgi:hypothetical protein
MALGSKDKKVHKKEIFTLMILFVIWFLYKALRNGGIFKVNGLKLFFSFSLLNSWLKNKTYGNK